MNITLNAMLILVVAIIIAMLSGCAGVSGNIEVNRPDGSKIGATSDGKKGTVYGQYGPVKGSTTFDLPTKGLAK
jgi:uncharacterized protein YceK